MITEMTILMMMERRSITTAARTLMMMERRSITTAARTLMMSDQWTTPFTGRLFDDDCVNDGFRNGNADEYVNLEEGSGDSEEDAIPITRDDDVCHMAAADNNPKTWLHNPNMTRSSLMELHLQWG
ncbi:hypothetical protein OIU84_028898 [Salix udensis]|uniref:Uncharacterized protein n=1 Tax=Salix udensis TaxID=889485 RepID=A0AAD6PA13_9ROSI|nr:hypothetical protein OIU84_028898 [Salix udensis]